jgi:subtilisin family serine protease
MTALRVVLRGAAALALFGVLLPASPAAAGGKGSTKLAAETTTSSSTTETTSTSSLTESWNAFVVSQDYLPGGDIDPTNLPVLAGDFQSLALSIAPAEMKRIELASASKLSTGKGVVVAILDGGFNLAHPAVSSRWTADRYDAFSGDADPSDLGNRIDDDGDGVTDLGVGHGTFVASLIARCAPNARLMPIRIADDEGRGTTSSFINGLSFAIEHGARVINVSFALNYKDSIAAYWLDYAESQGVTVVSAAGNDGTDSCDAIAKAPTVLAVGAVDGRDVRARFSNYGEAVAVYAPGVDLLAAYGAPTSTKLAYWSGTSFASAFGAGAAALILQRHPTWAPSEVRNAIGASVDAAWDDDGDSLVRGRLNLYQAASK